VLAGGVAVDFRNQTLFPNYEAGDRVEVVSLDGILEQFERVKLLKLDCEGSEFPILLTSRRLGRVERIVGEIHECQEVLMRQLPAASRVLGYRDYRAENIVEYLESFGFLVSVRASGERIYLLDACRSEPARRSR
jgi:hypothetical protein